MWYVQWVFSIFSFLVSGLFRAGSHCVAVTTVCTVVTHIVGMPNPLEFWGLSPTWRRFIFCLHHVLPLCISHESGDITKL